MHQPHAPRLSALFHKLVVYLTTRKHSARCLLEAARLGCRLMEALGTSVPSFWAGFLSVGDDHARSNAGGSGSARGAAAQERGLSNAEPYGSDSGRAFAAAAFTGSGSLLRQLSSSQGGL